MAAALVDVIQGHNVGVLDPAWWGEKGWDQPPQLAAGQRAAAPCAGLFRAVLITPGAGCWQWGHARVGASQDPPAPIPEQPPYLCRTAISFSMPASFPSSAFLAMHLMATSFWVALSSASTTSEKAPLEEGEQCEPGGHCYATIAMVISGKLGYL